MTVNRDDVTALPRLWIWGALGLLLGLLLGWRAIAWIDANDSHTGVGMQGFARLILFGLAGGLAIIIGLILMFCRAGRTGRFVSAAGAAFVSYLFVALTNNW